MNVPDAVGYMGRGTWFVGDVVGNWHVCHHELTRQYGLTHSEANAALVQGHRRWVVSRLDALTHDEP